MPDSIARIGGKKPAAPNGARSRSEAVKGERAKGLARIESQADKMKLAEDQAAAESVGNSSTDDTLARMNETLLQLHKMPPKPHKPKLKTKTTAAPTVSRGRVHKTKGRD